MKEDRLHLLPERSRFQPGWVPHAVIAVALVAALALIASRATHIPSFDGRIYADCVVNAAEKHLALSTLRCSEHISHAYMLFAGAIQMLSPGSYPLILVANTILFLIAGAAVYRLATLAFPDPQHVVERSLITAAFAVHPAILASVVHPNIDLPMLAPFLWGVVFALRRQRLALVLSGIVLVATKETGVLVYGGLLIAYALALVLPGPRSERSPTRVLLRLTPLALPVVVFVAYIAYRTLVPHDTVIWYAGTTDTSTSLVDQFLVPRIDRFVFNYLVIVLVLSFAWIGTGIIGLDAALGALRGVRREGPRPLPGAKRRSVRFLVVLWVVLLYLLTRFATYSNTRYFLPLFALAPLVVYASLVRFSVPPVVRRGVLGTLAALWLVSTVRTVDPVSRRWFGTMPLGDHRVLRMTSRTLECCAQGRDQLAYNLQFTVLSPITSDIAATLVGDSLPVFLPHSTSWFNLNPLDSTTHRQTLLQRRSFRVPVYEADDLLGMDALPAKAIYIALPIGEHDAAVRVIERWYDLGKPRRFERAGYWIDTYEATLRP